MENRRQRFGRVASKRTNDIINKIRILGNCANKSAYDYTEEDINKIFKAIDIQLKQTRIRLLPKQNKFSL